jgi:hypothetical protein
MEFKFEPDGCTTEIIIATIHSNVLEEMTLFNCKRNDKMIICHHESVCQEDKGFINHVGFVKIDLQIQKFV